MRFPHTIEEQLHWLQWLLPMFLLGFVTYYETNEHMVERQEGASFNFLGEIWFFGLLGPSLVWLVLFWVRRQWRERERVQADLQRAYAEVTQAQRELQRLHAVRGQLLQKIIGAQEEERIRIAREVHDQIGQTLTGLQFALKLAEDSMAHDPAQSALHLARAQDVIDQMLVLAHRLTLDLRPAALDDVGLAAAIRGYAEQRLEPLGISAVVTVDGPAPRLSAPQATELFRIVQEALTNVVKHSKARHVTVGLSQSNGCLRARIQDDGQGFDARLITQPDADGRGLGLLGMRERANLIDGRLSVESHAGAGTVVTVEVPYG
jgi:signal transduction histidine kinase